MAENTGSSGKAIQIQGISDMIEEFTGENREIFRREMVHNGAIQEGSRLMWIKKQSSTAQRYTSNNATDEELNIIERWYIREMYPLFYKEYSIYTHREFVNEMVLVRRHEDLQPPTIHEEMVEYIQELMDFDDYRDYDDEWEDYTDRDLRGADDRYRY